MVMRGSNDRRPELPASKWCAFSPDGGETWTSPAPWSDEQGQPVVSPSSCSQLVPWPDGRLFWLGNATATNPVGNLPRYPFVIAEVNPRTGALIRGSLTIIDDRQAGDDPALNLSNFYARHDRATGHLLLHLTRLFARPQPADKRQRDWTADALLYRLELA
jgi:hypothetical protein